MSEPGEYEAFAELVRRMDARNTLRRIWQLTGGVSAQVIGLEVAHADGSTRKLVARRHGATDRKRSPHIAADEFRLLKILRERRIAAPIPYFLEESDAIFDTPCLVMEYTEGETEFSPDNLGDYLYQVSAQLIRIHRVRGENLSFLPRQTSGFGPRPTLLDNSLDEERIRDALESLWPVPQLNESVLLHGDFWPGNILWKDGKLVAVLDWEDAVLGDPLADIANTRLELLWAFGCDAMDHFTSCYASLTSIHFFYLPYWDLCAALRPASKMGGWGLDADAERVLREKHRWFVAQALERLELSRD